MVLTNLTNFPVRVKKTRKVLNKPQNVKFTFITSFSKCCTGHLKCAFDNPEETFSPKNPMLPFNDRKLSYKSFCFREEICKWSSAQIVYGFENHAWLFCGKSKFFCLNFQKWLKKQLFQIKFPNLFLSAHWSVIWHTWLNNFAKRQRNHSNSKNDNRKRKLFRKRNLFSSTHFSGSANFCWLNPEKYFLTEWPIFFHLKVRRRLE